MAYESELEALPELEDEFEAELEDEMEDELEDEMEDEAGLEGEGWLGTLGNHCREALLGESEDEYEGEFESEDEFEDEISPIRKNLSRRHDGTPGRTRGRSRERRRAAEHFLPLIGMAASKLLPVVAKAVAPMAKRALPKIAKALTRSTPGLTRGIGKVAKALHSQSADAAPASRRAGIARRTVGTLPTKWREEAMSRRAPPCAHWRGRLDVCWARRSIACRRFAGTTIWNASSTGGSGGESFVRTWVMGAVGGSVDAITAELFTERRA